MSLEQFRQEAGWIRAEIKALEAAHNAPHRMALSAGDMDKLTVRIEVLKKRTNQLCLDLKNFKPQSKSADQLEICKWCREGYDKK